MKPRSAAIAFFLAVAAILAFASPRIVTRNEAKWTKVEVAGASRKGSDAVVTLRVRNVNGERRRIWVRGLDVARALLEGGTEVSLFGAVPDPLPIAGAVRFPVTRELAPRESAEFPLTFRNARAGARGHVDVVLDGSNWIRVEIALP